MEWGNPHSYSRILECGMWTCLFENVSFIILLKCIGMWNVKCGIWKSTFQFPFQNFGMWNVECGMWNCLFENVSFLTLLKCIGMWNLEWGNPHSNSYCRTFGIWNVDLSFWKCLIPHPAKVHWNLQCRMWNSTFQSLFQNFWNVECGIALLRMSHSSPC